MFVSVAATVIVSVPALVVIVTLEPAANVKLSVALSATILLCPLTNIFLNASVTVPPPPPDIVLNDKLPEPQNNLGNLYIYLNKYTEAINSFKKSIKNNINFYIAYFNLGILYKNIGNIDESKKCLHKAINLNPNFCSAHRAYSQVNKYKIGDKHINVMEKALSYYSHV